MDLTPAAAMGHLENGDSICLYKDDGKSKPKSWYSPRTRHTEKDRRFAELKGHWVGKHTLEELQGFERSLNTHLRRLPWRSESIGPVTSPYSLRHRG